MSIRERFVSAAISGEMNFSALCREYEITRKTGYKWVERARNGESMADRSRAPKQLGNKTPPETEALVLSERDAHPAWGPRKLERSLRNKGHEELPCKSTIGNILKRSGRIEPEESEAHTPFQRFERAQPNDLWQMDFKGDFAMMDGNRCYPLTMLDDHSRFSLCLNACAGTGSEGFIPVFTRVLLEFGLPRDILCDNGKPWGDSKNAYTAFDVWMMRMGILPIHSRPLHPQTQGKEERFHRTMKAELLKRRIINDLGDAQAAFDPWRHEYNHERPHEALGLDVPAKHYTPSIRTLEEADKPVEYDLGTRLRKVNYKGYLSIKDHRYYLGEAFSGECIALTDVDNDVLSLRYGQFEIARIDTAQRLFSSKRRFRF